MIEFFQDVWRNIDEQMEPYWLGLFVFLFLGFLPQLHAWFVRLVRFATESPSERQ